MEKLTIKLIEGDFTTGFTLLQETPNGQNTFTLPPAPEILDKYEQWRSAYLNNVTIYRQLRAFEATHEVTNFSQREIGEDLENALNQWLASGDRIARDRLASYLLKNQPVRLIIQTDNVDLWRLPWHLWDLLGDRLNVEVTFSKNNYEKVILTPKKIGDQVKILVILSESDDLQVHQDLELLKKDLKNVEIYHLKNPTKKKVQDALRDTHCDILFFAGHSSTQKEKFSGQFYITATETLTINDLKSALKEAINQGLKLAIFNSCDGLGLGSELADLKIPATIVMREAIPDDIAPQFLKFFLKAFAQDNLPLSAAVGKARRRLQDEENENFPFVSWLPAVIDNPVEEELTWRGFFPDPFGFIDDLANNCFGKLVQVFGKGKIKIVRLFLIALVSYFTMPIMGAMVSDYFNAKGVQCYEKQPHPDIQCALVNYNKALSFNPKNRKALNNRGRVNEIRTKLAEAESDFNQSMEEGSASGCHNLARIRIKKGELQSAYDLLNACENFQPGDKLKQLIKTTRVWLFMQEKEYTLAQGYLKKALQFRPEDGRTNCLWALLLETQGQAKAALPKWNLCYTNLDLPIAYPEELEWHKQAQEKTLIVNQKP